jgi:NAD+ synthase
MAGLVGPLINWLRDTAEEAGAEGAVVWLDGSMNAAVTATLLARAFGEQARGLILPCSYDAAEEERAAQTARAARIEASTIRIFSTFRALRTVLPEGTDGAPARLRARLRAAVVRHLADYLDSLVVASACREEVESEAFTGTCDHEADLVPLGALDRGEVRTLARDLGLPSNLVDAAPVPSGGVENVQAMAAETSSGAAGRRKHPIPGHAPRMYRVPR